MRIMTIALAPLTAFALLSTFATAQNRQPPTQPQRSSDAEAEIAPGDKLVATVNGDAITHREIEASVQPQLEGQQVEPEDEAEIRAQVLNQLINGRLIEQYAVENGPEVDQNEVDATLEQTRQRLESQGFEFDEFINARGYTPKSLEKRIRGSIAWQKLQQSFMTEENLQQHFEANRNQFPNAEYSEARPEVAQSFIMKVRGDIVRQTMPDAEIKVVDGANSSNRQGRRPATPQRLPMPQR